MKIPSLKKIFEETKQTFLRFPAATTILIFAITFFLVSFDCITNNSISKNEITFKIILFCAMAFPLMLSSVLIFEKQQWKKAILFCVQGFLLLMAGFSCILLPFFNDFTTSIGIFLGIILFLLYFIVFFIPYIGNSHSENLWRYSFSMINNLILSAFVGGVTFGGISLALLAIENLFSIRIYRGDETILVYLAMIFLIFLSIWLFLTRIPKHFSWKQKTIYATTFFKNILKYVFILLLGIYMLILYVYMFFIIFHAELPQGWVSYLILSLSGVGILILWFIYPLILENKETFWKKFAHYFLLFLLPLLVLLFVGIGRRISDYGITPKRYFLLAAAIWVLCFDLYFLISKRKNIILAPIAICIILLIAAAGPISAYSVSKRSQIHQLETLLTENKILVNGTLAKKLPLVDNQIAGQINSILQELGHYDNSLAYLAERWKISLPKGNDMSWYGDVSEALGLESTNYDTEHYPINYYSTHDIFNINGYDYYVDNKNLYNSNQQDFEIDNVKYIIQFSLDTEKLQISSKGKIIAQITIKQYEEILKQRGYQIKNPSEETSLEDGSINNLDFEISGNGFKFHFLVTYLSIVVETENHLFNSLGFSLLIKKSVEQPK